MPKIKDEERIEKIIRGLLKLPENKRCINCNSLGPQYVCTTFWTFVCTNCSGIHREFTHRVKSVSMAKFSAEEVDALQAGGNERARQIYFKTWDPQRNSFPNASNLHRLRDFIKHVYKDRKYAGAGNNDKRPLSNVSSREDYQERHSFETSRRGAREEFFRKDDTQRDDFFERHSFERPLPGRRDDRNLRNHIDARNSPRYKQETLKSGSQTSRAPRFEIVDDRFREDGFGSVVKFGSHRYSDTDSRARSSSPVSENSRNVSKAPALRPLKDILGEKMPPLKVGESPKANAVDRPSNVQTAGSSGIPGTVGKKEEENKKVTTLDSLIDFDANPEPTATTAVPQNQSIVPVGDGGKSGAISSVNQNAGSAPNANSLEMLLFGLADPAGSMPEMPPGSDNPAAIVGSSDTDLGTAVNSSANSNASHSVPDVPTANINVDSDSKFNLAGAQQPGVQQSDPFDVPTANNSFTTQNATASPEAVEDEFLTSDSAHAKEPSTNASFGQPTQAPSQAADATSSGNELPGGRKELPADLFASSYSSFSGAVPSWQPTPSYGMGYGIQYHANTSSMGAPPDSIKTRNPFDIGDDGPQSQGTMFHPMSPLQGPMANMSTAQGLQPQVSPYASAIQLQRPYGIMRPRGMYMEQQIPNNMLPSRPQGAQGADAFGGNDAAFASLNPIKQSSGMNNDIAFSSLNPIQQSNGINPLSAAPESHTLTGGNPFG